LLVGITAFNESNPRGTMRRALCLFAPLPEHLATAARVFVQVRAPQIGRLANELVRRKVVKVDKAIELMKSPPQRAA
jgi:hypothetical protein